MKRDLDLCREILLKTEGHDDPYGPAYIESEQHSRQEIGYNTYLLGQAGFVELYDNSGQNDPYNYYPLSMTWTGHEFLDTIRDDSVWNNVITALRNQLASVSLRTLHIAAEKYVVDNFVG